MMNGRDPPGDVSGYEVKHRIGFVHKLENWVVSRIVDPAGVSNTNLQSPATRHLCTQAIFNKTYTWRITYIKLMVQA